MNLNEKIVYAAMETVHGSPLKDYLTDEEIENAIRMLSDILYAIGFVDLETLYEKAEIERNQNERK